MNDKLCVFNKFDFILVARKLPNFVKAISKRGEDFLLAT